MSKNLWIAIVIIALFLALFSGCMFSDLKRDLQEVDTYVTITGSLKSEGKPITNSVLVVLIKQDDPMQPIISNMQLIDSNEKYRFRVPVAKYIVFAFEDTNGDQKYQSTERVGQSQGLVDLTLGQNIQVDVTIPEVASKETLSDIEVLKQRAEKNIYYKNVETGKRINVDSPLFSEENAKIGLWQPLVFIKTIPFGLFFLSDYDPKKIPVLFVHGVTGTPAQFSEIIRNIDQSIYQPWVLFYPSGFNISLVGAFLEKELNKAWRIFHFKQIVVVAHSMGGLVTRSFINQYQGKQKTYNIEKYITLSTPWNGHGAAGKGIQYAPTVIPVWEDVAPGSDFLETLFKQPLASETHHYLLFGYRGNSMFAGGNSDGVISIASQLRWEAQNGADRIYGFDEDHTSILQSSKAIKLINEVLKQ